MADLQSPTIALRSVDSERLEDVEDNPEAVQFRVRLSAPPSEIWVQEFEQAYRQTPYPIKPPIQVEGDALAVVFLPRYASELPTFFQFLGQMAARANEETRRTEEIHNASSRDRNKAELQAALRRIQLPPS